MRITFVQPPLYCSDLYKEWDLSIVDSVSPPLGLLLLAAITRNKGIETALIDGRIERLSYKALTDKIMATSPDVIGVTATTPSIYSAAELAKLIKQRNRDIKIIIGGPHITAMPYETMEMFPYFDTGILNEGDITIIEFLNAYNSGVSLENIKGLIFRSNGKVIQTQPQESLMNMDELPYPAWDMLPSLTKDYKLAIVGSTKDKSTSLLTSRGCPGQCIFCDTGVFGHRIRGYSAGYVVGMIKHLINKYGIQDFMIYDDTFVALRRRLFEICNIIKKENLKISWACCARVNLVDEEMLHLMKDAGCWEIEYGIESGDRDVLKFMKKGITLEQVRKAVQLTKGAGISTRGNFIFGNLKETKDSLKRTIDFALELNLDYFQQSFLTPYPGSEIYEIANHYGCFDKDWRNMSDLKINFIPRGLTKEELIRFSKYAFRRFYLRPKIIYRHAKRIKNLETLKRLLKKFLAFLKTIFRKEK